MINQSGPQLTPDQRRTLLQTLLMVSILTFFVFLLVSVKAIIFKRSALTSTGLITGFVSSSPNKPTTRDHGYSAFPIPVINFRDKYNNYFEFESIFGGTLASLDFRQYSVGQKVDILYEPNSLNSSQINDNLIIFAPSIFISIPLAVLLLLTFMIYKLKPRPRGPITIRL